MSEQLNLAYRARLCGRFPASEAAISREWEAAELLHAPGLTLPYARLEATTEKPGSPTVLYVNGFTEGIIAKLPFGAALAEEGLPVLLPSQLRSMPRFRIGNRWSTAAEEQAAGMLSVVCREKVKGNELAIVAHSYGGLVVSAMATVAKHFDVDCLDQSQVIMLAPAGMNTGESWADLAWRARRSLRAERKSTKAFNDQEGVMWRTGLRHAIQRPIRTFRELQDIVGHQVGHRAIFAAGVASLTVVDYAHDDLMPAHLKSDYMDTAIEEGVTWMTAYSPFPKCEDGMPHGIEGATHNDEQFNPHRVAPLVARLLLEHRACLSELPAK